MSGDVQHILTILAVEDLGAATSFYRAAFDWTPAVETPVYVEFTLTGGQRIGLYEREGFGRNTGQTPAKIRPGEIAATELYFHADDLAAAMERITRAGARELSPLARRAWGDDAAYFADPSGNVLVVARSAPVDPLLVEQIAYYRAIAPEYEDHAIAEPGENELTAALEAFRATGHVLELACGPGAWTERLLRHATSVTAVDAAPEMIARAKARVDDDRVRFIHADLFSWKPDRRYDVVFFGFWLSHVPLDRFESFWALVADCLEPSGRVFFVDDGFRTPDELIEGEASSTVRRRLNDGTAYRAVKVPHRPAELEERLRQLGWNIEVASTSGPFYWGAGTAAAP